MLLSSTLFQETRGTPFFRVLAGRNAPFYVDVLDAVERESTDRPEGMAREEVILIITKVLEQHPSMAFNEETDPAATTNAATPRDRAFVIGTSDRMPVAGGTAEAGLAADGSL